jgi:hypothetical protein
MGPFENSGLKFLGAAGWIIHKELQTIMKELDDLKREVQETKSAVAEAVISITQCAERVAAIIVKLQENPTPAELAAMAEELNTEQQNLAMAKAAIDGIAPAEAPTPA